MSEQTATQVADAAREILGWDGDLVIQVTRTDIAVSHNFVVPADAVENYGKSQDRVTTPMQPRWDIVVFDRTESECLYFGKSCDTSEAALEGLREKREVIIERMIALTTEGT